MRPASIPSDREAAPEGELIAVAFAPIGDPRFAGVVTLRGQHDIASAADIVDAIASMPGSVLVDFSECTFLDSSVVAALLHGARALERNGHRLELVVPVENTVVAHRLAVTGIATLMAVHVTRPG